MRSIGKVLGAFTASLTLGVFAAVADVPVTPGHEDIPVTLGHEFALSLEQQDPRRANGAAYDCLVFDAQDDEGARIRMSGAFEKFVALHRGGGCEASQMMSLDGAPSFERPNEYQGLIGPLPAGRYSVLAGASKLGELGPYTVAFDKWDGSTFRPATPVAVATATIVAASGAWTLMHRGDDGEVYMQPVERFVGRPSVWVRLEIFDRTIAHRSERIRFVAFCLTGRLQLLQREQYAGLNLGGTQTVLEGPFGWFAPEPDSPFQSVLQRACANEDMTIG